MHYKEKVNQIKIKIYKKKLTTTMDNKSLLNKNSFREDEFPFFLFLCVCVLILLAQYIMLWKKTVTSVVEIASQC